MAVRIEAGEIEHHGAGLYTRVISATDNNIPVLNRVLFASTKEELKIIDHEAEA